MKEIVANIWDVYRNYNAVCCTTNYIVQDNGELVMGAGIAKVFGLRYPWLPKNWGERVSRDWKENCHPGLFVTLMKKEPHLVYFGTKWHWRNKSDIKLIESSAWELLNITNILDWKNVLLPRPGCNNGGLSWKNEVKPILLKILDDRFVIITK